jgi:hypothetical protein
MKWRKFVDAPRGETRYQKELHEVTTTTWEEFVCELTRVAEKAGPHYWAKQWDKMQRSYLLVNIDDDNIVIQTDFSAQMDLTQSHNMTNCQYVHGLQDVFLVSHSMFSDEGSDGSRYHLNDAWHFWGHKSEDELQSNVHYHYKCMDEIVAHYQAIY